VRGPVLAESPVVSGVHGGQVIEGIEPVGAAAQLTGGLRATQHQQAENSCLVAAQIKDRADSVFVLGHATVTYRGYECDVFKRVKCLTNLIFREIKHGIAAGALIARVDQCIQRERIVFWGSDFFFDERAKNSELDGVERHILRVPHKNANYVKPF
jgi:hypothetical protein